MWAINDPYSGGTHLPDITLVSPTKVGFAVTRAHHADVGGREPGSMPANSRTLEEEGVVIPPTRIDDDVSRRSSQHMRNPAERRGDLRAQLAANRLATATHRGAVRATRTRGGRRGDGRALRLLGAAHAGRHH